MIRVIPVNKRNHILVTFAILVTQATNVIIGLVGMMANVAIIVNNWTNNRTSHKNGHNKGSRRNGHSSDKLDHMNRRTAGHTDKKSNDEYEHTP